MTIGYGSPDSVLPLTFSHDTGGVRVRDQQNSKSMRSVPKVPRPCSCNIDANCTSNYNVCQKSIPRNLKEIHIANKLEGGTERDFDRVH